jgi:hypothetical protein
MEQKRGWSREASPAEHQPADEDNTGGAPRRDEATESGETTSSDRADEPLNHRPGAGAVTSDPEPETPHHAAGTYPGAADRNLQGARYEGDIDRGMHTGFGTDLAEEPAGEADDRDNPLRQREPGSACMQREGVTYPQTEQLQRKGQAKNATTTTIDGAPDDVTTDDEPI